jgi:hypothetical protein
LSLFCCSLFQTYHSAAPDLLEPHILCSLCNVPIPSVHSSCSGNHSIAIDTLGDAWLFGRNASSALGMEGIESASENAPVKLKMTSLITAGQGAEGKRHTRRRWRGMRRRRRLVEEEGGRVLPVGGIIRF